MSEFLLSLGVFFGWFLAWAFSAFVFTGFTVFVASILEHYLVLSEDQTFPLWVFALSVSPAAAFLESWTLWPVIISSDYFPAIRYGSVAAGVIFALVAILVVFKTEEEKDKSGELTTLVGLLLADGLCCVQLVFFFQPILDYMLDLNAL